MTSATYGPCSDCAVEARNAARPVRPRKLPDGKRCGEHIRARAKAKKLRAFFSHVQRTYGITEEEYRAMYRAQHGKCYICRKATGAGRMLAVDHNHVTGEVRGLLCSGGDKTCNRVIGWLTVEALERAAQYLRQPPARAVLAQARSAEAFRGQ